MQVIAPTTYLPNGTGAAPRGFADKHRENVSVLDFVGADATGTADSSAAFLAALAYLQSKRGGLLRVPSGIYRIDSQLALPNDGSSVPFQHPIRLIGDGAEMTGRGLPTAFSGSVLDLRYAGAGAAKMVTYGQGFLECAGLTFTDTTGGTVPFFLTTNTTSHIHDCAFIGTNSLLTANQDCILLGGTSLTSDGTATSPFQGYGTVIHGCYFDKIRRAVYGRTFANAIVIRDNCIWNQCGSNLAGGAAIEFIGLVNNVCAGNVIAGNLIEMGGYPYGIKLDYSQHCTLLGNNCYDPSASTLAYVRCETNALYNFVLAGFCNDTKTYLSDVGGSNTLLNYHQSQQSVWTQPWKMANTLTIPGVGGLNLVDSSSNLWEPVAQSTASRELLWRYTPSGGATQPAVSFQALGTGQNIVMQGTGVNIILVNQSAAELHLRTSSGNALWLGDSSKESYFSNGDLHLNGNLIPRAAAGLMLGNAATNLMSLWGATPVVRPAAIADTSGATLANLELEVNKLKALLRTIGALTP